MGRSQKHISIHADCSDRGEDENFSDHHGFDFEAIEKAVKHNQRSRRIRGASTISQQLTKNLFLWPGRSFMRKGLEAYFTAVIELLWSKKRILEVYLNTVELGKHTFGLRQPPSFISIRQQND